MLRRRLSCAGSRRVAAGAEIVDEGLRGVGVLNRFADVLGSFIRPFSERSGLGAVLLSNALEMLAERRKPALRDFTSRSASIINGCRH